MTMISIITAIYNQLGMNRLYYETVKENTDSDWELIIIDNGSDDGSAEFFESLGDRRVRVVRNDGNYSYPYCQNVGIKEAKGDILAFLNNDILLSPHWDTRMLSILGKDGYEVLTLCSNDHMADRKEARHYNRRYKHRKYPMLSLFGARKGILRACAILTYGDWQRHCDKIWEKYGTRLVRGFAGSAVVMTRDAVEIFNGWDPTQQAADFDMYMRTCERWDSHGDIRPMSLVAGVYHHHFSRLTARQKYPPFKDSANLVGLEDKWSKEQRDKYLSLME